MDIKPGDVLFVWGHGLFPPLIEAVIHGPSHCAMFKNETTLMEAQAGKLVGECDLSFYLSGNAHLEVWGDPGLTEQQRAGMIEYAQTLYGIPYDYKLIPLEFIHFEFGMRLNWYHEHKHLICSTFTNDVALHEGAMWSKVANPAPIDELQGGALQKKCDLALTGASAS